MRRPKVKLECSNTNTKPDCPFGHITYQICKGAALLHCVSPRRAPDLRIRRGRCSSRLTPTRTIIGPTSLGKPVHNPPQNARKAGLSFPLPTCAFSTLRRRHFLQGPPWLSSPIPPRHRPIVRHFLRAGLALITVYIGLVWFHSLTGLDITFGCAPAWLWRSARVKTMQEWREKYDTMELGLDGLPLSCAVPSGDQIPSVALGTWQAPPGTVGKVVEVRHMVLYMIANLPNMISSI